MMVTKRSVPVRIGKMDVMKRVCLFIWENACWCDGSKSAGDDNYFRKPTFVLNPFLMIAIVITGTTRQFLTHRIRSVTRIGSIYSSHFLCDKNVEVDDEFLRRT